MTSRYTDALVQARREALERGQFVSNVGYSGKVKCVSCGNTGYPGGAWMDACLEGHESCPDCGKVKPVRTMRMHRSSRWHR